MTLTFIFCRAKQEAWCECFSTTLTRGSCNQNPLCITCGGKRSAAFRRCKAKVLLRSVYKIKASKNRSFSDAVKTAKAETRESETLKSKQKSLSYAEAVTRSSIHPQSFPDSLHPQSFPDFVRQSLISVVKARGNKDTVCDIWSVSVSTRAFIKARKLMKLARIRS